MPSLSLTRAQMLVLVGCCLVAVLALSRFYSPASGAPGAPSSEALASIPPLVTPGGSTGEEQVLVVDVAGAVRRPGLYRLRPGSRVADAVRRAGGTTRRAARDLVNLAAPLVDGQQVLVPSLAAAGGQEPGGSATGPVSLNGATVEQLDSLPGIGPVTAQKIVDFRTQHGAFTSVDDLDAIPGIGPSRIDQLRGLVSP